MQEVLRSIFRLLGKIIRYVREKKRSSFWKTPYLLIICERTSFLRNLTLAFRMGAIQGKLCLFILEWACQPWVLLSIVRKWKLMKLHTYMHKGKGHSVDYEKSVYVWSYFFFFQKFLGKTRDIIHHARTWSCIYFLGKSIFVFCQPGGSFGILLRSQESETQTGVDRQPGASLWIHTGLLQ